MDKAASRIRLLFNGVLSRFGKNILENIRNRKDKTKLIKLHYSGFCHAGEWFPISGQGIYCFG